MQGVDMLWRQLQLHLWAEGARDAAPGEDLAARAQGQGVQGAEGDLDNCNSTEFADRLGCWLVLLVAMPMDTTEATTPRHDPPQVRQDEGCPAGGRGLNGVNLPSKLTHRRGRRHTSYRQVAEAEGAGGLGAAPGPDVAALGDRQRDVATASDAPDEGERVEGLHLPSSHRVAPGPSVADAQLPMVVGADRVHARCRVQDKQEGMGFTSSDLHDPRGQREHVGQHHRWRFQVAGIGRGRPNESDCASTGCQPRSSCSAVQPQCQSTAAASCQGRTGRCPVVAGSAAGDDEAGSLDVELWA
mmetsp:Transcript_38958/g.104037  ORF Transcript_38958/g.104037 Transcript_38958/m.104037 type:complete len:300 (+) Transcript_38958:537-1436(+)